MKNFSRHAVPFAEAAVPKALWQIGSKVMNYVNESALIVGPLRRPSESPVMGLTQMGSDCVLLDFILRANAFAIRSRRS